MTFDRDNKLIKRTMTNHVLPMVTIPTVLFFLGEAQISLTKAFNALPDGEECTEALKEIGVQLAFEIKRLRDEYKAHEPLPPAA